MGAIVMCSLVIVIAIVGFVYFKVQDKKKQNKRKYKSQYKEFSLSLCISVLVLFITQSCTENHRGTQSFHYIQFNLCKSV